MRLLYIYIEEFRTLHKLELNFDSNMRFNYRDGVLTCDGFDALPPNFFSIDKDKNVVDSVSAVVGDNGSGKTSIAALLNYMFVLGRPYPLYICVCEVAGKIICYSNLRNFPNDDQVASKLGENWEHRTKDMIRDNVGCPFQVFYYSPYMHPSFLWGEDRRVWCHDISMTSAMNGAVGIAANQFNFANGKYPGSESPIVTLAADLNKARIKFLWVFAEKRGASDRDIPIPLPREIEIKPDFALVKEIESFSCDLFAENRCDQDVLNHLFSLVSNYSTSAKGNTLSLAILVFAVHYILSHGVFKSRDEGSTDLKDLVWLSQHCESVNHLKAALSGKVDAITPEKWKYVKTDKFIAFFECLAMLYEKRSADTDDGGFKLVLDSEELCDGVLDLIGKHSELVGEKGAFMVIDPAAMSAGECAYLNLFALLYQRMNSEFGRAEGPILLFLDEAETTLHPEWQRQMVYNVIWFLEHFAAKCKVHVVFATHSPMLLSDIPKSNCVFLKKTGGVTGVVDLKLDEDGETFIDTFGANIFDMYYHSFFMHNGTIGKFAEKKIDALFEKDAQGAEKVVDIVGDPFIRQMLEDRFGKRDETTRCEVSDQSGLEIDYPVE